MSYRLPDTLSALRTAMARLGMNVNTFATERQAAYLIQHALDTRFKFPPQGQSCFPVLKQLEAAVTGQTASEATIRSERKVEATAPKARKSKGHRGQDDLFGTATRNFPKSGNIDRTVPPGLVIYCDGACEPNPGAGGWGFAVYRDGVEIHTETGGEVDSTNNRMEIMGALMALRWFAARGIVEPVRLLCDSQYVVMGANEWLAGWKRNGWNRRKPNSPKREAGEIKNLGLWQEIDEALTLVPITLEWCRGHAGIVGNERADELSQIGRDEALERNRPRSDLLTEQLRYAV